MRLTIALILARTLSLTVQSIDTFFLTASMSYEAISEQCIVLRNRNTQRKIHPGQGRLRLSNAAHATWRGVCSLFMERSISSMVPSADDLLRLEIEEVGWVLLAHLASLGAKAGDGRVWGDGRINQYNFFLDLDNHPVYGVGREDVKMDRVGPPVTELGTTGILAPQF
jgi:hypothetical protein